MQYQIMEQRLNSVLERDKCGDPEQVCDILKGELLPIIRSFIDVNKDIKIRCRKEGESLKFSIEIDALRIRPFGYLPK